MKWIHSAIVALALLSSAWLAHAMTPRILMAERSAVPDLKQVVPQQFGNWKVAPNVKLVQPYDPDSLDRQLYSQEFGQGYVDTDGHLVMLLIAYGPSQSDRLQLHRPEICYTSQGFKVSRPMKESVPITQKQGGLQLSRLVAQREARLEPISYWMRVGDEISTGVLDRQFVKLKYGLRGVIPDGALIRVSTVGLPENTAFEIQTRFIKELLGSIDQRYVSFFVGKARS